MPCVAFFLFGELSGDCGCWVKARKRRMHSRENEFLICKPPWKIIIYTLQFILA